MLHAVASKKSTRARQYAYPNVRSEHDEIHKKWNTQAEDEINSTVIGPIELLNPYDSLRFWLDLVEMPPLGDKPGKTELVEFKLWCRRDSIEPDGFIVYKHNDLKYVFLLELKWNAKLEDRQLENQWDCFLTPEERKSAIHIFLGKQIQQATQIMNDRREAKQHNLNVISWQQFRSILKKQRDSKSFGFIRWAELANKFLERCGVNDFHGFVKITDSNGDFINISPFYENSLFWRPFSGFSGYLMINSLSCQEPVFYNQGESNEWE